MKLVRPLALALLFCALLAAIIQPTAQASGPQTGDTWTEPTTGMEFVYIQGGCYTMGDETAYGNQPYEVCLTGFWVGKYEVTNEQYAKFRPDHHVPPTEGQSMDRPKQPVTMVSYMDALDFAQWLSGKGPDEFTLPTEAQWEYAARGGAPHGYLFPWGNDPDRACEYANLSGQGRDAAIRKPQGDTYACNDGNPVAANVGLFRPNAYGLYDMIGNVYEWTLDRFTFTDYELHGGNDPVTLVGSPGDEVCYVSRGGSWNSGDLTTRGRYPPFCARYIGAAYPSDHVGFRLIRLAK